MTDALAWVLRLIAAGLWHGLRWGGSAVGHDGPRTLLWYALRYDVRGLVRGLRDSNMVCDRQLSCRASHYVGTHPYNANPKYTVTLTFYMGR